MLELADAEFMGIRDEIDAYQEQLPAAIRASPNLVLIDRDSLTTLIRTNSLISDLDRTIADILKVPLHDSLSVDFLVREFSRIGLTTIEAVESALVKNSDVIIRFAKAFLTWPDFPGAGPVRILHRGISIGYLAYILLLQTKNAQEVAQVLDEVGIRTVVGNEAVATALHDVYRRIQAEGSIE